MAALNPENMLQRELTCSVCLGYFKDPVSLDCGHNFCRACITQCWEGLHTNFRCPECRETFLQRNCKENRHLRNIVEASRTQPRESTKEPEVERLCEKHKKGLELFCQVDQTPVCMICHLSRDHKEHSVVPIEEAAEDYKEKIQSRLEILKKKRKEILLFKCSGENKSQELLKQLETEKQKIVSEFQRLCKFLKEQECLLLSQLEELNKEIEKRRNKYVAKLSEEISSFSFLIGEMEQKCQLPASEFLQDIKGTLSRCEREKFQNPVVFSSELKWRLWESSKKNASLQTIMKNFKDSLSSRQQLEKEDWHLDENTANPNLILCSHRGTVTWGRRQDLPNNPERFDVEPCVLGHFRFTSGRHYWEMNTIEDHLWAVGVAKESVQRKGKICFTPEQGIWAVERRDDQCWALTSPEPGTPLFLSQEPSTIRLYLDYEGGQVALFNAGNGIPIFSFPPTSFSGERLCLLMKTRLKGVSGPRPSFSLFSLLGKHF